MNRKVFELIKNAYQMFDLEFVNPSYGNRALIKTQEEEFAQFLYDNYEKVKKALAQNTIEDVVAQLEEAASAARNTNSQKYNLCFTGFANALKYILKKKYIEVLYHDVVVILMYNWSVNKLTDEFFEILPVVPMDEIAYRLILPFPQFFISKRYNSLPINNFENFFKFCELSNLDDPAVVVGFRNDCQPPHYISEACNFSLEDDTFNTQLFCNVFRDLISDPNNPNQQEITKVINSLIALSRDENPQAVFTKYPAFIAGCILAVSDMTDGYLRFFKNDLNHNNNEQDLFYLGYRSFSPKPIYYYSRQHGLMRTQEFWDLYHSSPFPVSALFDYNEFPLFIPSGNAVQLEF